VSDEPAVPTHQHADADTERRILDAARTVFIRRGTAGARMQEIAAEAGVNQALLHYYFRSKERLAEAVFREAAARLVPTALATLASELPLHEKVERFVHHYIDTVREHPYIPGYILAELHQHPERVAALPAAMGLDPQRMRGALFATLDAQLREGAAAGTLRPMTPRQFMVNLLSLVVFPFAARPLVRVLLGLDDAGFERFLDERRRELPAYILAALRP
jgi:AcrR family transcriptional regulator